MLFGSLVHYILANSTGEDKAQCAMELVGLPLNEDEQVWLEDYLGHGKGSKIPGAEDTIIVKEITTGRINGMGTHQSRMSGRKIDSVDWSTIVGKCEDVQTTKMRPRQAQNA